MPIFWRWYNKSVMKEGHLASQSDEIISIDVIRLRADPDPTFTTTRRPRRFWQRHFAQHFVLTSLSQRHTSPCPSSQRHSGLLSILLSSHSCCINVKRWALQTFGIFSGTLQRVSWYPYCATGYSLLILTPWDAFFLHRGGGPTTYGGHPYHY